MKTISTVIVHIMMLLGSSAIAQQFILDTLFIDNIVEISPSNIIDEGFGDGPFTYGQCIIRNNTNEIIHIKTKLDVVYCYKDSCYKNQVFFEWTQSVLEIYPGDSTVIDFSSNMMLDVVLNKSEKKQEHTFKSINHRSILNEVKESIRVVLYYNDKIVTIIPECLCLKDDFFIR